MLREAILDIGVDMDKKGRAILSESVQEGTLVSLSCQDANHNITLQVSLDLL